MARLARREADGANRRVVGVGDRDGDGHLGSDRLEGVFDREGAGVVEAPRASGGLDWAPGRPAPYNRTT